MFARFKVIILQLSMRVCIVHAFTADADMMWRRWSFEVSYVTKKKTRLQAVTFQPSWLCQIGLYNLDSSKIVFYSVNN